MGVFDPDGNSCLPPPHPATEAERDDTGISDRERVRRIAHEALDIFLAAVLDTPTSYLPRIQRCLVTFNNTVRPEVEKYRRRQKQRGQ